MHCRAALIHSCSRALVLASALVLVVIGITHAASADNAAFALAPRGASFAIDARAPAHFLRGDQGAVMRPVLEMLAGPKALATFDLLARRAGTAADAVAHELFTGRIAFFLEDIAAEPSRTAGALAADGSIWVLAFQSDDDRCERVLRMFNARLVSPGYFVAPTEKLSLRRVAGWLLMAPLGLAGDNALDLASTRATREEPAHSLLGEPLLQELLGSDAPLRIFMRHAAPIGGATTVALSVEASAARGTTSGGARMNDQGAGKILARVHGEYESSPLGAATPAIRMDSKLLRAFEDSALFVVMNPADGKPNSADSFWTAVVPELIVSPAMRANLSGDRLLAIGARENHAAPSLAFAWRVDDAEQGLLDQDGYMRGVCCGIARSVEPAHQHGDDSAEMQSKRRRETLAISDAADSATQRRECAMLGPMLDGYLGKPFRLGRSVLCWNTVATECGGWQVYASDPQWLAQVMECLAHSSCAAEHAAETHAITADESRDEIAARVAARTVAASHAARASFPAHPACAGLGFCDGPRAATLLRRWRPLATNAPNDRVGSGLEALAATIERLGRVRFMYELPTDNSVRATIEIDAGDDHAHGTTRDGESVAVKPASTRAPAPSPKPAPSVGSARP